MAKCPHSWRKTESKKLLPAAYVLRNADALLHGYMQLTSLHVFMDTLYMQLTSLHVFMDTCNWQVFMNTCNWQVFMNTRNWQVYVNTSRSIIKYMYVFFLEVPLHEKKKFKNRSSIHRALCYLKKPNKYIYILWNYSEGLMLAVVQLGALINHFWDLLVHLRIHI